MAITSLNQLDVYRIVHDFDRDHFNTAKPLRKTQVDRVIVIIQFERMLVSIGIPLELIDDIMRRCLVNSSSVGALLMFYKNTPAIALLHPLPLSTEAHYINTASKSLLVRLKQTPANGELASYRKLMTWVFTHHFKKLTFDQKFELIRRSNITPWEQRSTSQKLELLGRMQARTFWGKAKISLQLFSWKVQFAAAWALENNVIKWAMLSTVGALAFVGLSLGIARRSSYAKTAIYQVLNAGCIKAFEYFITAGFALLGVSLAFIGLGLALQISIFPQSLREKGAWLQSLSWNCQLIALSFLGVILISNSRALSISNYNNLVYASKELQKLLLQSINKANITTEQDAFANAHLPDLINHWLNLIMPNDTNTGSLQRLQ